MKFSRKDALTDLVSAVDSGQNAPKQPTSQAKPQAQPGQVIAPNGEVVTLGIKPSFRINQK